MGLRQDNHRNIDLTWGAFLVEAAVMVAVTRPLRLYQSSTCWVVFSRRKPER